jgi:hypothetical protein
LTLYTLFGCENLGRMGEAFEPYKGLCYFIIANLYFKVNSDLIEMSTIGLRECDRLDGGSNFIPLKLRLQMLVEKAEIWKHVEKEIATPTNPKFLGHY